MPARTLLLTLASCAAGVSSCDDTPGIRIALSLCPFVAVVLLLLVFLGHHEK